MSSRPYNRCSISSRIKSRLEKCRETAAKGTAKGDDYLLHEESSRPYTFDEEDEDNRVSSNESVSCFDEVNHYANATGDYGQNRQFRPGDTEPDVPPSPSQQGRKPAPYSLDDYDQEYRARRPEPDRSRGYPTELAVQAYQRLQQLKELQRRREYNERFYDQEIKRLIAGADVKTPAVVKPQEKSCHAGDHRVQPIGSSLPSKLEPCGTMTTITRLDCGCVEQTTRPIFTTPNGQVRKRSCAMEQQLHVRLSAPNPGSRVNAAGSSQGGGQGARLKSRSFNEAAGLGKKTDAHLILQQKLNSQGAGKKAASESSA